MLSIFVYGTLKPGYSNYRYCGDHVVKAEAAMVHGTLFELPVGYPAMAVGSGWVKGVRLIFADTQILTALDTLEDYCPSRSSAENEYQRVWVEIFSRSAQPLGMGWTYRMNPERIQNGKGHLIEDGEWFETPVF